MKYVMIALAFHRKDALRHIGGLKRPLRKHLVKLMTRPNDLNLNHWIIEVQEFLESMCDFTLKQESSLNEKVVYETIVGKGKIDLEQSIKNILKKLKEQEYDIHPSYKNKTNLQEEARKLEKFYELASQAIADHFMKGTEIDAHQLLTQSQILP